jgi:transcriptional regulator with XRE-family HTH domain
MFEPTEVDLIALLGDREDSGEDDENLELIEQVTQNVQSEVEESQQGLSGDSPVGEIEEKEEEAEPVLSGGEAEAKPVLSGGEAEAKPESDKPKRSNAARGRKPWLNDPFIKELVKDIDWKEVGLRLKGYRLVRGWSVEEMGKQCELTSGSINCLESGTPRKSPNHLWGIVTQLKVSINWLFKGIGEYFSDDPPELLPQTIIHERGAGIRRKPERVAAEEGAFSDDPLDFVMAVDAYKRMNNLTFVTWTEAFEVLIALGYRRVAEPTINPHKPMTLEKRQMKKS